MATDNKSTYTVIAACNNCNFKASVCIKKGVSVQVCICPECGCIALNSEVVHTISLGDTVISLDNGEEEDG